MRDIVLIRVPCMYYIEALIIQNGEITFAPQFSCHFLNKGFNKKEFNIIFKNLVVMFLGKRETLSRVVLTGAIGICSFIGDQGLKHGKTAATRAIFDNVTHAIVGGLTWAVILNLSKKSLAQNFSSIFWSFCLSSFIDVDHFIAACSWKLSDATHLEKRPFFHCTTLPITIWIMLSFYASVFNYPNLGYYSWIILASFLSHHIRDGTRRGLWFCPIGSTQPIPYYLYLSMSMMLPHVLQWLMVSFMHESKSVDNETLINIV